MSSNNGSSFECQPEELTLLTFYGLVPILQFIANAVPLLAIVRGGRQLSRMNSVYIYVKSTLMANLLLAVFSMLMIVNFAYLIERPSSNALSNVTNIHKFDQTNAVHQAIMTWWAFRKAFTACLALVMCNSVVGLIYGLKQKMFLAQLPQGSLSRSMSFAGRAIPGITNLFGKSNLNDSSTNRRGRTIKISRKRLKAYTFVTVTWLVAIGMSLLSTFSWNCIDACLCLPGYYRRPNCPPPEPHRCSTVWLPVSVEFVATSVAVWIFEVGYIAVVLFQSIRGFYSNMHFAKSVASSTNVNGTKRVQPMVPRDRTLNYAAIKSIRNTPIGWPTSFYRSSMRRASSSHRPSIRLSRSSKVKDRVANDTNASKVMEEPSSAFPSQVRNSRKPTRFASKQTARKPTKTERDDVKVATNTTCIGRTMVATNTGRARSETTHSEAPSAPAMNPPLKLVIFLSITVVFCTLPTFLVYGLDIFMDRRDGNANLAIDILSNCMLILYSFSCPVLLFKYLFGVKRAMIKLLLKCDCTRTFT